MRSANRTLDVLGIGCTAVDELLFVPRYPGRDSRQPLNRRERHCGGMAATALVAAARLGASTAYAGVLGDDEDSRFVRDALLREKVDLSYLTLRRNARPVRAWVVVEEETGTRTILYDVSGAKGADPRRPPRALIESARVLLIDRWGMEGMLRAARIARDAGVAVVGDLENFRVPRFDQLLALPDHLIVPEAFVRNYFKEKSLAAGMRRLWRDGRKVVVATQGRRGCLVMQAADAKPVRFPAVEAPVIDTTGCGDVFHGAYAAALARGMPLHDRITLASGAAAMKAGEPGGQKGIPTLRELRRFLRRAKDQP